MQSDWDIVERGWKAHVLGEAEHTYTDPNDAIKDLKVTPASSAEIYKCLGAVVSRP